MDDESSDILGQQTKPVLRGNNNDDWFGVSLTVKLAFGLAILLVLYVAIMRIWFRILVWRERSYKLAMRRRHGIPDNDHRPFNVAYAAAVRARQEKEAAQKAKAKAVPPVPLQDRRNTQTEQNVRQRFALQTASEAPRASSYSARLPGAYLTESTPARSYPELSTPTAAIGSSHYTSQAEQTTAPQRYESGGPSYLNGTRRSSRKGLDLGEGSGGQKRGFVEDPADEQEATKRSKRDSGFIGDEVNDATWLGQALPQRGAKRYLFDEEDSEDDLIERQPRDKRARKVSLDKGIQAQEEDLEMDIDEEEDDVDDLPYIQRGKKRDRAEAGSTFGGDDDESSSEHDNSDLKSKRRRRKRRTFSNRKSDAAVAVRGRKRDRDVEEDESELETGDENSYISRKKRGKKSSPQDGEMSEHSTARSQTSSASRNRRIGEEWTSNGIRWKMGPNGQRLRQALVRKARQRFPMPEDSQHPDREVDFEVYVESWLTEEEYRDAKARHALAGQDTPNRPDPKLAVDVQTHVNGKNLLWSSTSTPVDSPLSHSPVSERAPPVNQRIARSSLVSSGSPRTNPFDQVPTQNMRRISSISRTASAGTVGSPGLADSTNSSPHARFKTYSKLEKQELEAQALMRLRELKSKKEAEANQLKEAEAAKEKENLDKAKAASAPSAIPTITVTAPTEASKPATPLFNLSNPGDDSCKPGDDSCKPSDDSCKPGDDSCKPGDDSSKPGDDSSKLGDDSSKSTATPQPPPLFGFPSTSTAAQPSTDAAKPSEAPKPPLFGGTSTLTFPNVPAATEAKADDKPVPPSSASSMPFSQVPSSSTAQTNQPTSNFFTTPADKPSATGSNEAPKTSYSFAPSTSAATSANTGFTAPQPTSSSATTKPIFSFGFTAPKPATEQKAPETTQASQSTGGGTSLLARLGPPSNTTAPETTATPSSSQPSTLFNFGKPSSSTTTTSTQPKFNFGFTAATNTSSTNAPTTSTTATTVTTPPAPGNPPQNPMVTFSPLTPNGGTKDNNPTMNDSNAPKAASNPSLFRFNAPVASASNTNGSDASKNAATSFGTGNPFGINTSNMTNGFGSTAFGSNPAENKPAESSSSGSQAAKPLFNFATSGSQPSSNNASGSQDGGIFGSSAAIKPAPESSSLFGALGPQSTNAFGSTSTPGSNTNVAPPNIFGSSNAGTTSNSASTSVFGGQPAQSTGQGASGSQPSSIFGNTGTGMTSGFEANVNKPAEAPKSVFSFTHTTNGTSSTTNASEPPKPSFQFNMPRPNNNTNGSSNTGASTTASAPNPGSPFTFGFGSNKNNSNSTSAQPSLFGNTTSGAQSAFAAKPSTFNIGSSFAPSGGASTGGSSFNPLGAASQSNATEQK